MSDVSEKKMLIIGSYGAGNIGDEAILTVLLRELPAGGKYVLSGDVADTLKRHKNVDGVGRHFPFGLRSLFSFGWWKSVKLLKKSTTVILGGGGLFTDSEFSKAVYLWAWHVFWALRYKKPVVLFLNSFGPVRGAVAKRVAKWVLARCEKIILRDELSLSELRKLGNYKASVGFDPVVLYGEVSGEKKKKIALNLRDNIDGMGQGIKWLESEEYEVLLVATGKGDSDVMKKYGEVFVPNNYDELLKKLSECEYCIGMRLHFLLAGALAGCKVSGISYNLKVAGILQVLDLYYQEVEALDFSELFNSAKLASNLDVAKKSAKDMFKKLED